MQSSRAYLAAQVLTEGNIVSYRTLGRYLGISSNESKKILQEFYHQETSKKPSSIHAIYLITGIQLIITSKEAGRQGNDNDLDAHMTSSPFLSSSVLLENNAENQGTCMVMSLAKEENLEITKTKYQHISSMHIYSLGPSTIQNLQILADGNRALTVRYVVDGPLDHGKQYGAIQNMWAQHVMRGQANPALPSSSSTQPAKALRINPHEDNTIGLQNVETPNHLSLSTKAKPQAEAKVENKSHTLKRAMKSTTNRAHSFKREPINIFKSFSNPTVKPDRGDSNSSAHPAYETEDVQSEDFSCQEDELIRDVSDKEDQGVLMNNRTAQEMNSKNFMQRTEHLRQMMEEEDASPKSSSPTLHAGPRSELAANIQSLDVSLPKPQVSSSASHRRGRRKIVKKKMLKDEEGYLVTKEEPSWESFSEDEPLVQKASTPIPNAVSMGKGKKTGVKHGHGQGQGHGNIKSFFGQK